MPLYVKNQRSGQHELTKLHPGDVLCFDLNNKTICINRPPSGTVYFGDLGQPSDGKAILYEMASSSRVAFSIAKLLADAAGLHLDKDPATNMQAGIVAFELKP